MFSSTTPDVLKSLHIGEAVRLLQAVFTDYRRSILDSEFKL